LWSSYKYLSLGGEWHVAALLDEEKSYVVLVVELRIPSSSLPEP
jgi:hypothetical protein